MTQKVLASFGELLRRLRLEAGHSRETLAERAGISMEAIRAYERGLRQTPRRETIALLVDALQLTGEARTELENAARGKGASILSSRGSVAHNLPWQPTSFIGRGREVREVAGLLAPRRLTTVTGTGGIGKTRVAIEVASHVSGLRNGVCFVDLAPVTDGAFVAGKISSALDLRLPDREDRLSALVSLIEAHDVLLILDNCEHIIAEVRSVANAILRGCPHVRLLATSRERLAIAGEQVYRLSTLSVPPVAVTTAAEGLSFEAIELFAERAAAAEHRFVFSDEHVEAATDVCRRLDGIALAIELAAARLPTIGLSDLRAQLAKRFHVIAGGPSDLPARQRTLAATISWSHDLLEDRERVLLRRLAVFANGWTLDAAEDVCSDDSLPKEAVLDALFSLVEQSLVVADLDRPEPRYSLFESTRAFAAERLAAGGEFLELSRRHARWMATFADRAHGMLAVTPRLRWEMSIAPEVPNAFAALDWASGPHGDVVLLGRIASGLEGFWQTAGLTVSGREYVNTAIERIDGHEHPALVARLLIAQFRSIHGAAAADAMKRAISLLEPLGDRRMLARCYGYLSYALGQTARYFDAGQAIDKALSLLEEEGLKESSLYSGLLCERSNVFRRQGLFEEAKATLVQSLSLAETLADHWYIAQCQIIRSCVEFELGDMRETVVLAKRAHETANRVGNANEAHALNLLACAQLALGDIDAAQENARRALELSHTVSPSAHPLHVALQHLAAIASLRNQPSRAARLYGYVNAWYERTECPRDPIDEKSYAVLKESLPEHFTAKELLELTALGAQFTEDAAVREALT